MKLPASSLHNLLALSSSFIRRYWILLLIVAIYATIFSVMSLMRFRYFYTGIFDLGNMNQTIWNTLHGHFFMETDPAGTGKLVSRLSDHADFFLLLLTPLYALFPTEKLLLVIQAIIVACGAVPVYFFTREKTISKFLPYFFAIIYLLLPSVENPTLFEFHAVTLSMTFILSAFYFLYKRKFGWGLLFTVLSLSTKEEVGFTICLMACYFFIQNMWPAIQSSVSAIKARRLFSSLRTTFIERKRENLLFIGLALVSCIYSFILIRYIIPYFRGGPSLYLSYYDGNSGGLSGILSSLLQHPFGIVQGQWSYALKYTADLLLPVGGLSIFSPLTLIIALPEWLIDCLSKDHFMQSIFYQYPSVINPFIILSAISGFFSIDRFLRAKLKGYTVSFLVCLVMITTSFSAYHAGQLPLSMNYVPPSVLNGNISKEDRAEIDELEKSIPSNVSISADNNLGSHLSSRPGIYLYPEMVGEATYLILRQPDESEDSDYQLLYAGQTIYVYKKLD